MQSSNSTMASSGFLLTVDRHVCLCAPHARISTLHNNLHHILIRSRSGHVRPLP
jgi:hypothetical protein